MVSSFCRSYVAVDPGNVCGVAARNWVETQSGADTLLGLDGSFGETAGSIRVAERDWRAAAADEYASFQTATNHERVRDNGAAFCCDRGRPGISSTHLIGRAAVIAPAPHHGSPVIGICVVAWLSGLLFLLLRWSRAWWDIRGIVRSASPISLGMAVSVLLTERMIEPGIVGIFRPVLLLPDKIMDRLSAAQLRTILAHESCHVQRRDNLTAAIHMMVEAVFWFHPGVWWIERRLIEERERACDEAVLQQGNEPETYAESILNVCKFYKEASVPCVSGVTGSELKRRILRIMTKRAMLKLDLKKKVLLGAVAAAGILVPIAVGLFRVTEAHAQSDSASPNSIVATWQGVLHADRDLHFVVKITSRENGGLRGIFYNIDAALGGISAEARASVCHIRGNTGSGWTTDRGKVDAGAELTSAYFCARHEPHRMDNPAAPAAHDSHGC